MKVWNVMPKVITLLLLWVYGLPAFSQYNDSTHHSVNYVSTGTINKTNEGSSYVLNNALRFGISRKEYVLNTTNSWVYGKSLGNLSNSDFFSALDGNLYKTWEHFYYWGLASYEKSFSLKINNRSQGGFGVGYSVFDREELRVVLSDGILYERSDLYDTPEDGTNRYDVFRNSFRLKFRIVIREVIIVEGSDFLQHALSDRRDYIVKSNTSLSIKLKKGLSITSAMVYNKLSKTQRENLLVTYGLTYERYF
ncbi:DUF481 domain-containing protein [Fulvivirgaceae bacterium PWU5]|uniref:DUF481 domain-containing protein n=1 Tax=Dawidia cretensis TaxID=2782350 RepID=A0AAP2GUI6_9BACT|nr:DUF481 domain-containing protein [Dawidia cretensis]MBT1708990.1 DUF481 domain-containing protein [Dawidia cretensis]